MPRIATDPNRPILNVALDREFRDNRDLHDKPYQIEELSAETGGAP